MAGKKFDAGFVAPPPRAERVVTSADGTAIAVRIYGPDASADRAPAAGAPADGPPTVVLAHGWSCGADFWAPQIRDLAADLRVVAYDQRGHGASGRPEQKSGYSADALADDLAAVLADCVPAGRTAVLAGHSMGGFTALSFAGRYPELLADRISAVALVSTAAGDLVPGARITPGRSLATRARGAAGRLYMGSTLPAGRPSPISRGFIRRLALSPSATPAQVEFATEIVLSCPRRTRGWCGAFIAQMDLSDDVKRLTVPTVVVVGTADRLTPPAHSRRLATDLPDVLDLVELPGVGHMAPIEDAPAVTAQIRRLVDLTPPGGPASR